jgi:hypothetical protein
MFDLEVRVFPLRVAGAPPFDAAKSVTQRWLVSENKTATMPLFQDKRPAETGGGPAGIFLGAGAILLAILLIVILK